MINSRYAKLGVFLIAVSGWVSATNAGSSGSGVVSNVIIQPSGQMFFFVSAAHSSRPACASTDRWVIDTSKLGGQAASSGILAAFSSKRPVAVQGSGACDVWGDTETVAYITLPN